MSEGKRDFRQPEVLPLQESSVLPLPESSDRSEHPVNNAIRHVSAQLGTERMDSTLGGINAYRSIKGISF